jgi:hypothetical protein
LIIAITDKKREGQRCPSRIKKLDGIGVLEVMGVFDFQFTATNAVAVERADPDMFRDETDQILKSPHLHTSSVPNYIIFRSASIK